MVQRSYVIVTHAPVRSVRRSLATARPSRGKRAPVRTIRRAPGRRQPGRHRIGTPGTAHRYPDGAPAAGPRRPRHRADPRRPTMALRSVGLLALLGTVLVSGWYATAPLVTATM